MSLKYTCPQCHTEFEDKWRNKRPRVCCSNRCSTLYRIANGEKLSFANNGYKQRSGEGNPAWKGDKITVKTVHIWLNKHYPRPRICEECGTTKGRVYDFALIAGKSYERKRENFRYLCRSCHMKYDYACGVRKPRK